MKWIKDLNYIVLFGILFLFILLFSLYITRMFTDREIDDVTPGIYCEPEYIAKSDVLWIIPIFNNKSIAKDKEWCNGIKALNKTLGMHGVYHTFNEFNTLRNEEYIKQGISAFEECFGYTPRIFKPPQLALSFDNKKMLENLGLNVEWYFNQWTHKVYHCSDTQPTFDNGFNDRF